MILAWVKLPEGVRPAGGALTSPAMLRGSPFSSHFWFTNRTYTRDLLFAGISHEFYHQITFWLTRDLGYDAAIFPSNHLRQWTSAISTGSTTAAWATPASGTPQRPIPRAACRSKPGSVWSSTARRRSRA